MRTGPNMAGDLNSGSTYLLASNRSALESSVDPDHMLIATNTI